MVASVSIRLDKKERKYARILLEGLEGSVNVMVFNSVYEQYKEFIEEDAVVFVEGRVDLKFGEGSIQAEKITPLDGAITRKISKMHLKIPTNTFENLQLNELNEMFQSFEGDCEIIFHIFDKDSNAKTVRLKKVKIEKFLNNLHKFIGKEYIRLE